MMNMWLQKRELEITKLMLASVVLKMIDVDLVAEEHKILMNRAINPIVVC